MNIREFIFLPDNYEFDSKYSLSESVARLRNIVGKNISGEVSSEKVFLEKKYKLFTTNSFKPVFYGKLEEDKGNVKLVGKFTTSYSIQIIYIALFTIFIFIGFFGLLASKEPGIFEIFHTIILCFGIILVRKASEYQTRNEKTIIRNAIIEALR